VVVCLLGIGSRRFGANLPTLIATYAGDTLWALAAFVGIGLLRPKMPTWRVGVLALSFSLLIEISQLYHAPWIDSIRRTTVGSLILGFDFVWSDLACYIAGIALGIAIEVSTRRFVPQLLARITGRACGKTVRNREISRPQPAGQYFAT
jgi:hypothetical protein